MTGAKKTQAAAASAAPSGSSAAKVAVGPCGEYAAKFCAKAGEESEQCNNFKDCVDRF